jgi:hypothetical protein
MRRDFTLQRRAILAGVIALVAADVAMAIYSWNLSSARRPQQDLAILSRNRDLLKADITRAENIRLRIPKIQEDCDKFEGSLFPASTGYSSVTAELGSIASKSGLQLESRSFHQTEIKGRDLQEVEIEAVVNGSYPGVVHFLNGLQRSSNVYGVVALEAKGEAAAANSRGEVRVSLHIRTYFRNA